MYYEQEHVKPRNDPKNISSKVAELVTCKRATYPFVNHAN